MVGGGGGVGGIVVTIKCANGEARKRGEEEVSKSEEKEHIRNCDYYQWQWLIIFSASIL